MRKWTNDPGSAGSYSAVFDAFGQVVSQSGSRPPYGFGADWAYRDDGDAGLLHIGARWYDPVIGRWTTADKYLGNLFDPRTLNRHTYCGNDPINLVDPTGLSFREWLYTVLTYIIGSPAGEVAGMANPNAAGGTVVIAKAISDRYLLTEPNAEDLEWGENDPRTQRVIAVQQRSAQGGY